MEGRLYAHAPGRSVRLAGQSPYWISAHPKKQSKKQRRETGKIERIFKMFREYKKKTNFKNNVKIKNAEVFKKNEMIANLENDHEFRKYT